MRDGLQSRDDIDQGFYHERRVADMGCRRKRGRRCRTTGAEWQSWV